ncbi:MAG TPA: ATP-binding cassette domain-containing protein [Gaiellaceae bacterium]
MASTAAPANEIGTVAIECRALEKRFGHLEALRGADLTVRFGEITALLGDNGAGKSTLVKCISGAYQPDGGELLLLGEPTRVQSARHAQELGIQTIYQDLALAPDLSVLDNLFLGRELTVTGWRGRLGVLSRSTMQREAEDAIRRIGVRMASVRSPVRDLSGGQRQAVAVTKAMRWATNAILMDEPTAALGARQRKIVYEAARSAANNGLAVVMISHDIPQMVELADRIAVMRQGVVVAQERGADLGLQDVMALMLGAANV